MKKPLALVAALLVGMSALFVPVAPALAVGSSPYGPTSLVSVDAQGGTGGVYVRQPALSGDGRYVVFSSLANTGQNFGHTVPQGVEQTFRRDRQSTAVELVSTNTAGDPAAANAIPLSVSDDGRYVLFYSQATNLASGVPAGTSQMYVKDMTGGHLSLVSSSSSGDADNRGAATGEISGDGRFVTFYSDATNLVSGDTNNTSDIFFKNVQTGEMKRVSQSDSGQQGNSNSMSPQVSQDGQYVTFMSRASNLVAGTFNGLYYIYVADTTNDTIRNIIVPYTGTGGPQSDSTHDPGSSTTPFISGDGSRVVFQSFANNLVPGDTNRSKDTFMWDDATDSISRISLMANGDQLSYNPISDNYTLQPVAFSANGQYVLFNGSGHGNGIVNGLTDARSGGVFLLNVSTGEYKPVSLDSDGKYGSDFRGDQCGVSSNYASLSANGLAVAVESDCVKLDPAYSPRTSAVYVHEVPAQYGPRIVGAADRQPNVYGWYNGDVTITWTLLDPSGQYGALQGASQTVVNNGGSHSRIDSPQSCTSAGDCITGHYYLSIDKDAPVSNGALVANGFGQGGNVTLNWPVVEPNTGLPQSGIPFGNDYISHPHISGEYFIDSDPGVGNGVAMVWFGDQLRSRAPFADPGAGHTIGVRAKDKAGNWTAVQNYPADSAAPVVTGTPNDATWHNSDVTIHWNSVDPEPSAGVPTQPADTLANVEGVHTYTSDQSCDMAGNCATGEVTVKLDKTKPTISYAVAPAANGAGWNNGNVTVTFTCADALSGVASCSAPVTLSGDGAGQSATGTAVDAAGNTQSVTASGIKIDKTLPHAGTEGNLSKAQGQPMSLSVPADDITGGVSGSGVVGGEYFVGADPGVGNATAMVYAGGNLSLAVGDSTFTNLAAGVYQLGVRSRDAAGNWSVTSAGQLTVILPAPTGLSAASPTSNAPMLTWDPVPTATSYRVYRTSGGTTVLAGTVSAPSYTDTYMPGVYDYTVVAVNAMSATSAPSGAVQVAVVNPLAPKANEALAQGQSQVVPIYGADVLPGLVANGQTTLGKFDFDLGYTGANNAFQVKRNFTFMYDAAASHFLVEATSVSWLVVNGSANSHATFQGVADVTVGSAAAVSRPFTVEVDTGGQNAGRFAMTIYTDSGRSTVLYRVNQLLDKGKIDIK